MKKPMSASDRAKQRLILSAIKLFAEQGVDSVSLRMINREAGQKNNSALHYHFGSKMGLVSAVDQFIQIAFDEVREPLVQELESKVKSGDATIHEAITVFVMPYVEITHRHEWGYAAIRAIARMEFDANLEVQALLSKSAGSIVQRLAKIVRPMVPALTPKQFKRRFNLVVNQTIMGFAEHRSQKHAYLGDLSFGSLKALAEFHIAAGIAVLESSPGES